MSRRRCFLHCRDKFPLHGLPKEDEVKTRWLKFIFTTIPADYNPNLSLCSLHFTEDSFLNLAQFNAGYSKRLVLKDGAVPTLLGQIGHSGLRPRTADDTVGILPTVRHVASQTEPPESKSVSTQLCMETTRERKSVATQLSLKTLQNHRSKATQVRVSSRDCGVCTLTFPLDSPLLFLQPTIIKRPSKRPRLSIEHEEEGPSEHSLPASSCL